MGKLKTGSVDTIKTVKAGCGIRYDPEQMDDSIGFDFSMAEDMKPENDKQNARTKNESTMNKSTKNESTKDEQSTNKPN